jgi:heme-degrading monooxygenase HmoA
MVVRIWHGKTKRSDADRYLDFLHQSGVKDYLKTPGNLEVKIWRSIEGDVAHFWTVSSWDTMESIKAFAGDEVEKAKYYPEDNDFLLEFEPTVKHYEQFSIK